MDKEAGLHISHMKRWGLQMAQLLLTSLDGATFFILIDKEVGLISDKAIAGQHRREPHISLLHIKSVIWRVGHFG